MEIGPYVAFFGTAASVSGAFYGPDSKELGAVFRAAGPEGTAVIGTLMGRHVSDMASSAVDPDLAHLTRSTNFNGQFSGLSVLQKPTGEVTSVLEFRRRGNIVMSWDAPSNTYTYWDTLQGTPGLTSHWLQSVYAPINRNAPLTDGEFTGYQIDNGGTNYSTLRLFRPAGDNAGTLQLTYLGFGQSVGHYIDPQERLVHDVVWFIYRLGSGQSGTFAQYPGTNGTATYTGRVFGVGTPASALGTSAAQGSLSGTANFAVNFTAQTMTGSMNPIFSPNGGGASVTLPTYTFGYFNSSSVALTGVVTGPGDDSGEFYGWFLGPQAQELGLTFSVNPGAIGSETEYFLNGVIAARKD